MSTRFQPTALKKAPPSRGKSPSPAGGSLGKQASPEAGRRAAAILEVLGGLRTPADAATALKVSVNYYYLLERRALAGLLAACEPQPKGPRSPGLAGQLTAVERQLEDCRRECLRQAALVRATQRAVGLPAASSSPVGGKQSAKKDKTKRRRRRPTVRALQAAETVRKNSSGENPPPGLEHPPTDGAADSASRTSAKEAHGDTAR